MPIQQVEKIQELKPIKKSKAYPPKTRFEVVGWQVDKIIIHQMPDGTHRNISGNDLTAKDLAALEVNIDNWLDRGLIERYTG